MRLKLCTIPFLLLSVCLTLLNSASAQADSAYSIVGHEEPLTLFPGSVQTRGRLDTGATRSSLHAQDIAEVLKDGQTWLRFTFVNELGEPTVMMRPLEKRIRVRQVSGVQRRYVITLGVCLGPHFHWAEFTLADRSGMRLPVLIGRNILSNDLLVTSSAKDTLPQECQARLPESIKL